MTLQYLPLLADAKDFASPEVYVLPRDKSELCEDDMPLERFTAHRLLYSQARGALFHLSEVLNSHTVWLPAYHCPALVEPFAVSGKNIKFYPVTSQLQPDLESLAVEVRHGDAVIAVRYFGFDCGIERLFDLCKRSGAVLIEDLAHSPFIDKLYGEFAVTSLWKFFPIERGAELCISTHSGYRAELMRLHNKLPGRAREWISRMSSKLQERTDRQSTVNRSAFFDSRNISKNLGIRDRKVLGNTAAGALAASRRSNYVFLSAELGDSSLGKPLFAELPDRVIPYVFPFLLDNAGYFNQIRNQGIQVYRWEQLAISNCEISREYRSRLIQLPCHQQLSDKQLLKIVEAVSGDH